MDVVDVQVKELGAVVYNCSCLANDLGKIFEAYWYLGKSQSIPSPWPTSFSTLYNKDTPLQVPLNNTPSNVYLSVRHASFITYSFTCTHEKYLIHKANDRTPACRTRRTKMFLTFMFFVCLSSLAQSSPPSFCAAGRTQDLQSILSVMEDAHSFIYIAVMNYLPTMEFSHPKRYCWTSREGPKFNYWGQVFKQRVSIDWSKQQLHHS